MTNYQKQKVLFQKTIFKSCASFLFVGLMIGCDSQHQQAQKITKAFPNNSSQNLTQVITYKTIKNANNDTTFCFQLDQALLRIQKNMPHEKIRMYTSDIRALTSEAFMKNYKTPFDSDLIQKLFLEKYKNKLEFELSTGGKIYDMLTQALDFPSTVKAIVISNDCKKMSFELSDNSLANYYILNSQKNKLILAEDTTAPKTKELPQDNPDSANNNSAMADAKSAEHGSSIDDAKSAEEISNKKVENRSDTNKYLTIEMKSLNQMVVQSYQRTDLKADCQTNQSISVWGQVEKTIDWQMPSQKVSLSTLLVELITQATTEEDNEFHTQIKSNKNLRSTSYESNIDSESYTQVLDYVKEFNPVCPAKLNGHSTSAQQNNDTTS